MRSDDSHNREGAARRYRIDDGNLAARRELLGFGEREIALIAGLGPWMRRTVKAIVADFYDAQFHAAASRTFLARHATGKARDVDGLRRHLEALVEKYLIGIVEADEVRKLAERAQVPDGFAPPPAAGRESVGAGARR